MLKLDTKSVPFTPVWDGNRDEAEPIKMTLSRLSFEDYWRVAAICTYINSIAKIDSSTLTTAKFESHGEVMREITPVFKAYISDISGLYINDKPAKPEDLIKTAQLFPLVIEILAELLRLSSLDNTVKKKLEASSPDAIKTTAE